MSISLIVTKGYSNGSLVGSIKDLVTTGYDISAAVIVTLEGFGVSTVIKDSIGVSGTITDTFGESVKI